MLAIVKASYHFRKVKTRNRSIIQPKKTIDGSVYLIYTPIWMNAIVDLATPCLVCMRKCLSLAHINTVALDVLKCMCAAVVYTLWINLQRVWLYQNYYFVCLYQAWVHSSVRFCLAAKYIPSNQTKINARTHRESQTSGRQDDFCLLFTILKVECDCVFHLQQKKIIIVTIAKLDGWNGCEN